MTPQTPERHAPRPSRSTLVAATFASQLLGALVFSLAAFWLLVLGDRTPLTVATLALGAIYVFAAGMAYRGSINSLGISALLDVVVGIACITKPLAVKAFALTPLMWIRPALVPHAPFAMTLAGLVALAAAAACIAAVPQTRRFVAWRNSTLTAPVSGSLHPS